MQPMIRITTYEPRYKQDFIRLNKQWIETWFRLEQSDLDTFAHIEDSIIGHGGQIFLAIDDRGQVVGCLHLNHIQNLTASNWLRWLYCQMHRAKVSGANLERHCSTMPAVTT